MNKVEPYCECPQCHVLGLHYMAKIHTDINIEVKRWCEIVEVPSNYVWYDDRDEPAIELKAKYFNKETKFYTEQVVRECFYCSHVFYQDWKEWYE